MEFKEINDIIDYYRSQDCHIIKLHYDYNTIILEMPDGIKTIKYQIHWETNGEYFYTIV